jgi:hypothetical protein
MEALFAAQHLYSRKALPLAGLPKGSAARAVIARPQAVAVIASAAKQSSYACFNWIAASLRSSQ